MKKSTLSVTFLLVIAISLYPKISNCQQYINRPELNKFGGLWQFVDGQDTILLKCGISYVGNEYTMIQGALFYYTYKQGSLVVWNNQVNSANKFSADFVGGDTNGANNDSIIVIGKDRLKNKTDEGFFIFNSSLNQLKWVRRIGINAGGLNVHTPGQTPIPGYTLPAVLIFTKYVPPIVEMRKPQNY
jgi:hypothetical protein